MGIVMQMKGQIFLATPLFNSLQVRGDNSIQKLYNTVNVEKKKHEMRVCTQEEDRGIRQFYDYIDDPY